MWIKKGKKCMKVRLTILTENNHPVSSIGPVTPEVLETVREVWQKIFDYIADPYEEERAIVEYVEILGD